RSRYRGQEIQNAQGGEGLVQGALSRLTYQGDCSPSQAPPDWRRNGKRQRVSRAAKVTDFVRPEAARWRTAWSSVGFSRCGRPWMWASWPLGHLRGAAHGYEATREAAMAAFAKSWRQQ